jgi:CO/xanthine dehydrogenase FAD-binding subunit
MSYPDYIAPSSLDEALEILGDTTRASMILAGGTNIIQRLHTREIEPHLLVDILRLPLSFSFLQHDCLYLGAGSTYRQVIEDPLVTRYFPALTIACQEIGSPSIRNRGTLGGNLAVSIPEANTVPALLAYDAQLLISNKDKERTLSLSDLYGASGESILPTGDLIKTILIQLPPPLTAARFIKFGFRRGMATAVVNVAVRVSLDQDRIIRHARIALGSYADRPFRAVTAENLLLGHKLDEASFTSLARLVVESYPARTDLFAGSDYRKKLAMALIDRALQGVLSDLERVDLHD